MVDEELWHHHHNVLECHEWEADGESWVSHGENCSNSRRCSATFDECKMMRRYTCYCGASKTVELKQIDS